MSRKVIKRLLAITAVVLLVIAGYALLSNYRASALASSELSPGNPTTASLVEGLHDTDANVRAKAATALSGTEDRADTAALLAALADEDPSVGYASAVALSHSEDPVVRDALIGELGSNVVGVRQRAVLALSQMDGTEAAVPALSKLLDETETAQMAARALVRLTSPAAQEAILQALADEEWTTRRHAAMVAIEEADPIVADAILGQALSSDNLILVRNATILQQFLQ